MEGYGLWIALAVAGLFFIIAIILGLFFAFNGPKRAANTEDGSALV